MFRWENCVWAWNGWMLGGWGRGWGEKGRKWGAEGLPAGLTLINWGLVRFVEISVLKWASVSSSPSPGALRGYLVVIPSNFLGFFFARCLLFRKKSLEKEAFSAVSSDRSDTVGDDVTEAYQRQHPHTHLPGLMFHNCTKKKKFVNPTECIVASAETRRIWAEIHFGGEMKGMNNKD